ncbi:hypothetical protein [Thiococcus pfennigii]|uniref:hypothetical protein n=1 Tax=Thiococcus pfennigii TaxID=1057 RepID=UPI001908A4B9|nr:hypothetical protein [Thiococcus pfennigii]
MRDLYILAEQDILQHGQSTAFKGQQLTVADLAEIRRGRREWEQRAAQEANSAAKVGGLPHSLGSFSTRGRS